MSFATPPNHILFLLQRRSNSTSQVMLSRGVNLSVVRAFATFPTAVRKSTQVRDVAEYFHFTRAIVGSISSTFAKKSIRLEEPRDPIDLRKATRQHQRYVEEMKKLIKDIVQIRPDDRFPDLVYVEDPAVVLDGTALLAQMNQPSRAGETTAMGAVLEDMGLRIVEMREEDAYLDGGDVIFTGREFLVGLSRRTNAAGVEALARAFPEWPVTGITVQPEVLHLKSMCSVAGVNLLAIGGSEAGRQAWRDIESMAHYKYKKLVFPDNNGANCMYINGVVLHPPREEYPESFKIWESLDCPRVAVANSEMAKADGSLTCNSVRIN